MKTLIFSLVAVVGLLLVAVQHQQLGQLRAENTTLQQASTEADQLKADLAKSTSNEAQDAAEIDRLREENRDLLKLRNEVFQLREARVQFEKVSAENLRLQSLAKNAAKTEAKPSMQPTTFRIDGLFNRGLGTPEDAVQTFYWAQHEQSTDAFVRSVTQRSRDRSQDYTGGWRWQELNGLVSIDIVARRDVDATTVQLGLQLHKGNNPQSVSKIIVTLMLENGEWRVDIASR